MKSAVQPRSGGGPEEPPAPRNGSRRSEFLQGTLLAGGSALVVGAVAGSPLVGNAQGDRDIRALNLLLMVEYAEDAFYREALERADLRGELRNYATAVSEQEREHLAFVKQALGGQADPKPRFEFGARTGDPERFAAAAAELEDAAVAACNGQAPNVSEETCHLG